MVPTHGRVVGLRPLRTESGRWAWPLGVVVFTTLNVALPLLHSTTFYLQGDSASQFAPTWYHLGRLVRGGQWPVWIDPAAWTGGNYVGEALFGVYNPLNALTWIVASQSHVLVGTYLVKLAYELALALGCYVLSREYGAARWASAVMASALPAAGFTMFFDAPCWAAGLAAFAYAPWAWWAFRRTMRGRLNPFWAFLIGALAVTNGNPYGTLAVVLVGLAVFVEALAERDRRGALRVLAVGGCVAALLPLVYLPLLDTVGLSYRASQPLFGNTGELRPDVGGLFGLSSPTYLPVMQVFGRQAAVPATYFSWFVVPLLPWFRFGVLRDRGRSLAGLWVVMALYLILTIGPSQLWMFRWPIRLVEYLDLALAVAVALLLSQGLARDHWRARATGTAAVLALISWLTWAQAPTWLRVAVLGPAVLVVLVAAVLAWHRWGPSAPAWLAAPLLAGTALVVLVQGVPFPVNANLEVWKSPHDATVAQRQFGRYPGPLVQFANPRGNRGPGPQRFLAGSQYDIAGVEAINHYTGMGYGAFAKPLCQRFNGWTRSCGGFRRLWQPLTAGGPDLADLIKVRTVLAIPSQARGTVPAGWSVRRGKHVVTVVRTAPLPYPDSRLSWVTPSVDVRRARTLGPYHQQVVLRTGSTRAEAVFGMLDWPGYRATFAGRPAPVQPNRVGLLTVRLPAGRSGTLDVTYRPPHLTLGLAAAALGVLGALLLGLAGAARPLSQRLRRRRATATAPPPPGG